MLEEDDLQVQVAGKPKQVALDLDPITLEDATSYTAFAIGSLMGKTLTVVPAVDAGEGDLPSLTAAARGLPADR